MDEPLPAADEFLSPRLTIVELEEARNDPEKARERFFAVKGTDFASEFAIVRFLEEVRDVIADYDLPDFLEVYARLLSAALRKFNLRYRVDEPFTVRFLLPGSFTNLYVELQRMNASDSHLAGLPADFEKVSCRSSTPLIWCSVRRPTGSVYSPFWRNRIQHLR
jgi:hypothetical protein